MLKIFVCEDNDQQRKRITEIVENIIIIENLDMELALSTEKPEAVLDFIKGNDVSGMYFLDVDLRIA